MKSAAKRSIISGFFGTFASMLVLLAFPPWSPASGAHPASQMTNGPSVAVRSLLKQLSDRYTNNIIYDKDGSIVSVNLFLVNEATEKDLKLISELTSIKKLYLLGGYLTEGGAAALQKLTNLTTLQICGRNPTNNDLWDIRRLSQLRSLNLVYMSLRPEDVPYLRTMTNLTELRVSHADMLGSNALTAFTNLIRLKSVALYSSLDSSGSHILARIYCLTNLIDLENLTLGNFADFEDQQLRELGHLPKLQRLRLWQTRRGGPEPTGISDNWPEIVRTFPALTNAEVTLDGKTNTWNGNH